MNQVVDAMREKVAHIGHLLYQRSLTDAAGGNISARVGDFVCVTPRFSGSKFRWALMPEQVLVTNLQGEVMEGEGETSREMKVHLRLYQDYPDANAVVHCHAANVLAFAMLKRTMPPVLEDTLKFGLVEVCQYAPAHSSRLSEFVARAFQGKEAALQAQAAGVIAPWHGLFVMGKDLDAAYDAAERMDTNARCILLSGMAGQPETITDALRKDLADFEASEREGI